MKNFFTIHRQLIILLFCVCVGFFLRVYNFNWDQGLLFHPDERNIANAVTKIQFFHQLNPGFFAYGGFSIYLYRAAGDMMVNLTHDMSWISDWGRINNIGRFFSAIFSTLTLIPLFFIAKKLFGEKVGYLSCLLYTFTVTLIQHAHFATTESSLTFFAVLLCFLSLWWIEKPSLLKSILLGIVYGISLATKTSALLTILFPAAAVLLYVVAIRKDYKKFIGLILSIIFFVVATAIFAFILSPYSLLDFKDFYASMQYESGVATGSIPVVYTLQFTGSVSYIFQIANFVWQLGPLLTIFAVTGFMFVIFEPLQKKEKNRLVFWIFPLVYFLYVGSWHTKFLRYMVPVIPFFIISASYFLITFQKKLVRIGNIIIFLTIISTMLWALAFFTIYTRPQTRIVASTWIYQHIPTGSTILTEEWDDGLPVPLGQHTPSEYNEKQLDMYSADNPQKVIYLATMLSGADYVSINSKRLYATLTRLTSLYPITSHYYKLLFSGKLGYRNVATFASYPELFGLLINDDSAEETFQVFDHTKVLLLKNTKHYPEKKLEKILLSE